MPAPLKEIAGILCLLFAYGLVFLLGEYLRRVQDVPPEVSRKTIHIGGGLVALVFPLFLKSHWSVFLIAALATAAMLFGKRRGMLPSLDDVSRITNGSLLYPWAIYICFLCAQLLGRIVYYEISVLVLGLADGMAALTGTAYGRKRYLVEATDSKSVEGSITFFVTTFIITEISLLLFTPIGRLDCILVALLIALLVTLFEAISMQGADNLAIPFGTIFILAKNSNPETAVVLRQFWVFALALFYVCVIAYPYRKVRSTSVISMVLALYTAGGLVNSHWMLPLAVAFFAFCRTNWFLEQGDHPYRARPAFYLLVVPIFWILGANLLGKFVFPPKEASYLLFPSFITAVICQMLISRQNHHALHRQRYAAARVLLEAVLLNLPILLVIALIYEAPLSQPLFWCSLLTVPLDLAAVRCHAAFLSEDKPSDNRIVLRARMLLVLVFSLLPTVAMLVWRSVGAK